MQAAQFFEHSAPHSPYPRLMFASLVRKCWTMAARGLGARPGWLEPWGGVIGAVDVRIWAAAGEPPVIRHVVPDALPRQLPPLILRRPVHDPSGVWVCGDHRDTASIQGALVSGRRTAAAVLRGLRRGEPDGADG